MRNRDLALTIGGTCCTLISIYQLTVLGLASFYTLFSIGMSLLLTLIYRRVAKEKLFESWKTIHVFAFWLLLLLVSVIMNPI